MKFFKSSQNYINPISAGFIVTLIMLLRVFYFYSKPDSILIGVIPDDAFYYIQMAKHRVMDGIWTFDGSTPATGFHFLYGYILVLIYSVFPNISWHQLYLLVACFSSISIGFSSFFLASTAQKNFGRNLILISILPFLSEIAVMQSTGMMESSLVLLFSSVTVYCLFTCAGNRHAFAGIFLIMLGVLGSLSRSDYGMLPGIIFCIHLIGLPWIGRENIKKSALVLFGALVGIAIITIQNHYISGNFFQASAQIKLYWSSVIGHDVVPPVSLILHIVFPFFELVTRQTKIIWSLIIFIATVLLLIKNGGWKRIQDNLLPILSGSLVLISYILFYRFNSQALAHWYSGNLIAPISLTLAGLFSIFLIGNKTKVLVPKIIFSLYLLLLSLNIFHIPFPQQAAMRNAGLYLRELKSDDIYASWNAGIISYFSGKKVINLDGLTNDELLPYIRNDQLFDYLIIKNIRYIVDFEGMLTDRQLRLRGGYTGKSFDNCITSQSTIDRWGDSRLMIFKVIKNCH